MAKQLRMVVSSLPSSLNCPLQRLVDLSFHATDWVYILVLTRLSRFIPFIREPSNGNNNGNSKRQQLN
ncbi:predicted protein [Sclerotinia sclerotiorum 1980 UF-70]|uniref:Uncharacterized protein n=1 Tax=Sclerotinia sclerotiorum (strain ATCC 18683 / 1980 / Ss-1) TaxID=665079 RepID=A7E845_SCLS1|nr:predicted protein [Sclerotinia sclerotiorum 1980 UF-70]EDN96547.1 predicted protein [Sclerotinia sclerotiorum 1980 UF-70]